MFALVERPCHTVLLLVLYYKLAECGPGILVMVSDACEVSTSES